MMTRSRINLLYRSVQFSFICTCDGKCVQLNTNSKRLELHNITFKQTKCYSMINYIIIENFKVTVWVECNNSIISSSHIRYCRKNVQCKCVLWYKTAMNVPHHLTQQHLRVPEDTPGLNQQPVIIMSHAKWLTQVKLAQPQQNIMQLIQVMKRDER